MKIDTVQEQFQFTSKLDLINTYTYHRQKVISAYLNFLQSNKYAIKNKHLLAGKVKKLRPLKDDEQDASRETEQYKYTSRRDNQQNPLKNI